MFGWYRYDVQAHGCGRKETVKEAAVRAIARAAAKEERERNEEEGRR